MISIHFYIQNCVSSIQVKYHRHLHFTNLYFFFMIYTNFMKSPKLCKVHKFKDFYIFFRCSPTTVSTCPPIGNMSHVRAFFTSYPFAASTFTSRASVAGSQLT